MRADRIHGSPFGLLDHQEDLIRIYNLLGSIVSLGYLKLITDKRKRLTIRN